MTEGPKDKEAHDTQNLSSKLKVRVCIYIEMCIHIYMHTHYGYM